MPRIASFMYRTSTFVFWVTLILFLLVLFQAKYMGVYLTYWGIPAILASGLIMRFTKPKVVKVQGPFSKFVQEARAFVRKEHADMEQFFKEEADALEKMRLERHGRKPVSPQAKDLKTRGDSR